MRWFIFGFYVYCWIVVSFFLLTNFGNLEKKYEFCEAFDILSFYQFNSAKDSILACDKRIVEHFGEDYEILMLNDKYHDRPIQSKDIYIEAAKQLDRHNMNNIATHLTEKIDLAIANSKQKEHKIKNKSKTDYDVRVEKAVSNALEDIKKN